MLPLSLVIIYRKEKCPRTEVFSLFMQCSLEKDSDVYCVFNNTIKYSNVLFTSFVDTTHVSTRYTNVYIYVPTLCLKLLSCWNSSREKLMFGKKSSEIGVSLARIVFFVLLK